MDAVSVEARRQRFWALYFGQFIEDNKNESHGLNLGIRQLKIFCALDEALQNLQHPPWTSI